MWQAAAEIAIRSGGDPGYPGLRGPLSLPQATKPTRLVALETEGWARADAPARTLFENSLEQLAKAGIQIIRRADSPLVEALERAIQDASTLSMRLISWEQRWSLENLIEQHPGTLGPSLLRQLESGRALTLDRKSTRLN